MRKLVVSWLLSALLAAALLLPASADQSVYKQPATERRPIVALISSLKAPVQLRDSQNAKPIALDAARDRWRPVYEGQQVRCMQNDAEISVELPSGRTRRIIYASLPKSAVRNHARSPGPWISPAAPDPATEQPPKAVTDPQEQARLERELRFRQQIYQEKTLSGGLERAAGDTVLFSPLTGSTVRADHLSVRWNPFKTYKASVRLELADMAGRPVGVPVQIKSDAGFSEAAGLLQYISNACEQERQRFQLHLYDGAELKSTTVFTVLSQKESAATSLALAEADMIAPPSDRSVLRAAILRENHLFNEAADALASLVDLPEVTHSPYALFRIYSEQVRIGNTALVQRLAKALPSTLLLSAQ